MKMSEKSSVIGQRSSVGNILLESTEIDNLLRRTIPSVETRYSASLRRDMRPGRPSAMVPTVLDVAGEVSTSSRRQRGSLMVLLSWVLVALSLIALSFSRSVRMEVKATTNDVDLKQSYYIARSGVFYAIARILLSKPQTQTAEPQQQPVEEEWERGKLHFEMANGAAEIAITDESGKINVNHASEEILRHLMSEVGLQADVGDAIVDSILDWRDPDKDVHLNGAEDDYYMSLPEPYHIKDGPLDSVEELLLVKGITPEIFYGQKFKDESGAEISRGGLTNFLTVYAPYNRININSAPLEVLASLPGMNRQKAQMVVSRRAEKPFSNPTQVGEAIGLGDMNALGYLSTFRTGVFALRSVGRLNGRKIISVIRCTFSLDGVSPTGYRMIYWNENNLEL